MVWFLTVCSNSFIKTQNKIDVSCAAVFCQGLAADHYLPFPLLIHYLIIITDCNIPHTKIESKNLGYSLKNIIIPSKANYLKSMMDKVDNFNKRIPWKAHFFNNPMMPNNDNYTNYCLRSNVSPPQNPALTTFENDIYNMVRNIEFRKVHSNI